ncbi:hypothetical protein S140_225 [Shewanella sp. phage 1/40]|uniref:hypothetical protein n=1 Tax=Shewanella sp. phage 1/40 TaxID=1458860 RepID=UPI0004F68D36|nr:hypothetical protein S140_225 [Shewanella sp. phage 1/40]AHK11632.1 hypothetical protein S140_225 [Shewanella sp. phage 1/40]
MSKSEYNTNKGFTFTPTHKPTFKAPVGRFKRLKRIKVVNVFKCIILIAAIVILSDDTILELIIK